MKRYLAFIAIITTVLCSCTKIAEDEYFYGVDDEYVTEIEEGAQEKFVDAVYDAIEDYGEEEEEEMVEAYCAVCDQYKGKLAGFATLVKGTAKSKPSGEIVIHNPMVLYMYIFDE